MYAIDVEGEGADAELEGELLAEPEKKIYMTQAARANYLCLDRPTSVTLQRRR